MNPFRHFGRAPWTGDRPIARPLPTQDGTYTKRGHIFVPLAGFEPTIPGFERWKITRGLDGAAIGIG